jgi:hypothetical protein
VQGPAEARTKQSRKLSNQSINPFLNPRECQFAERVILNKIIEFTQGSVATEAVWFGQSILLLKEPGRPKESLLAKDCGLLKESD